MNLFWGALIVVAVTALAVTCMLLVRRRAPEGSYFRDGDRAAGVFGVGHRLLRPARLHHLPGVQLLRRIALGRRQRGHDRRPPGRDRAVLPAGPRGEITGQLIC